MGEFLQRTTPATKAQVLGSQKRAREFNRLVSRDGISPDEALRRVTNFRERWPEQFRRRSNAERRGPRVRSIPKVPRPDRRL